MMLIITMELSPDAAGPNFFVIAPASFPDAEMLRDALRYFLAQSTTSIRSVR